MSSLRARVTGTAVTLALAALAVHAFTTTTERCRDCKIVRVEVEATGNFEVTVLVNGAEETHGSYSRSFAVDIEVAPGETKTVAVTAAPEIDRRRRQITVCTIRENGKYVHDDRSITHRSEPGKVATCEFTSTNVS